MKIRSKRVRRMIERREEEAHRPEWRSLPGAGRRSECWKYGLLLGRVEACIQCGSLGQGMRDGWRAVGFDGVEEICDDIVDARAAVERAWGRHLAGVVGLGPAVALYYGVLKRRAKHA